MWSKNAGLMAEARVDATVKWHFLCLPNMKEVLALMESCLYFKVLMENFMDFGCLWILGYMVTLLARVVSGL